MKKTPKNEPTLSLKEQSEIDSRFRNRMMNLFHSHGIQILVGLVVFSIFAINLLFPASKINALRDLDLSLYDTKVNVFAPSKIDDRIVIVDIDEKSLAELGRWPWSRSVIARLTTRLFNDYGVGVLGYDVLFSEQDNSTGLNILEQLGRSRLISNPEYQEELTRLRKDLDFDAALAQSLAGQRAVLGYFFEDSPVRYKKGVLPAPAVSRDSPLLLTMHYPSYSGNLPVLQQAAGAAGHLNPMLDNDGIVRRIPLLAGHDGQHYDALSLAMLKRLKGNDGVRVVPAADGRSVLIQIRDARGSYTIESDDGTVLIPFVSGARGYKYVPAADVLGGRVPVDVLRGKIVFFGTSALGLADIKATPVSAAMPGVEVHAAMLTGLLDGTIQKTGRATFLIEILLLLVLAPLAFLLPARSPLVSSAFAAGSVVMITGVAVVGWKQGYNIPVATHLVFVIGLYVMNTAWGWFAEAKARKRTADVFSQYVPAEVARKLARDPDKYTMRTRQEYMTVLFADVRGFTNISEKVKPEQLGSLMNDYFNALTPVILKHKGTLDKYIGDAIMAFWGAPVADTQHARNAVIAALRMQRESALLSIRNTKRLRPEMPIGIGINSGLMTVGDMGSTQRKTYTALGDAVNLAARLESLTKAYGLGIIVSEFTKEEIEAKNEKHGIVFREIDRVRVKGKQQPITIFEAVCEEKHITTEIELELKMWAPVLEAYKHKDWRGAMDALEELADWRSNCALYQNFKRRLAGFAFSPPPPDWDGVMDMESV